MKLGKFVSNVLISCYSVSNRSKTKKSIISIIIGLVLASCSGGRGGHQGDTSAIEGTWSILYEAVQCEETYVFNSDGSWNVRSLDEVVSGTYTYSPQQDSGQLALTAIEDNLQADCLGRTTDSRGITSSISVELTDSTQMIWSFLSNGQVVFTETLNRN